MLVLAALNACARPARIDDGISSHERWALAFTNAQRAAAQGDYVRADTTLLGFTRLHPGTPEAFEAVFWRGVFALDPANSRASAMVATASFDEYLRSRHGLLRRHEAEVLLRMALMLDTTSAAHARRHVTASGGEVTGDARDEEIRRLRDELRAAKEELERVRRRIATPPPPPDTTRPPASRPPSE